MTSVPGIAGFLAFVAPGLIFELLRERHTPGVDRSAFREASAVALASLICTLVAVAILAVIRWLAPDVVADPRLLLGDLQHYLVGDPSTGLQPHYRLVARTAVMELALSGIAAFALYRLGPREWRQGTSVSNDAMFVTLRRTAGSGIPYVRILTDDGVAYEGQVATYDTDGPLADRVIVLTAPLKRHQGGDAKELVLPWQRLLIRCDRIAEMHVAYGEAPAKAK